MTRLVVLSSLVLLGAVGSTFAQTPFRTLTDDPWCRRSGHEDDHARWCEVREATLPAAAGALVVDASPNGGVQAKGADRSDIRVRARVEARGGTEDQARATAAQVKILTGTDGIRSEGPRADGSHWWVSFEVEVPRHSDLRLSSVNGPVAVSGISGHIDLSTENGPVSVSHAGGAVKGRTVNGPITAELDGSQWSGAGLDLETTNGPVTLGVPEGYNARLETGTLQGPVRLDFPVSVSGNVGHSIETTLGAGGAPVRARTTNGPVRLRRAAATR